MKKGNQVKIVGKHSYCGRDGIVKYDWRDMYRHTTAEEVQAWRDSPESKGMNSAGETKLPPRCVRVKYNGGTIYRPNLTITPAERIKLSEDTFTVVRARCAPILGYHKHSRMTLVRNNRTGEEGYIRRDLVEVING